ncbi:MAG: hypothetical protein ACRDDL_00305 [Sarcina sp.]
MKKWAYSFGIIGYFAIFVLCSFEIIMMSVNSYGPDTLFSLYSFFGINIIAILLLVGSLMKDKFKIETISFNMDNQGIAITYLLITIVSIFLLMYVNGYTTNASDIVTLVKSFINSPDLYLPLLPSIISALLFVVNDKITQQKKIQKIEKKRLEVSIN